VFKEDSVQFQSQNNRIPGSRIRPDEMAIPSGPHQCVEASNKARLQPFGRHGNTSGPSSEFEKIPVFKCIRSDDVVIPSGCYS
jgi:hypothetical protein